jgi:hypothetical protein
MSKALAASCTAAGVVMAEGVPVPAAEVLSAGQAASTGLLIIDGDKAWYFPSSAADISATITQTMAVIDKLNAVITQLGTTLTSIGAGMTGPTTAPPPTLPTDVIALNLKVTELTAIKTQLDVLKGGLQ